MQDSLFTLTEHASERLRGNEVLLAYLVGEESDFVRFNHSALRQAMTIRQAHLTLSLIDAGRRDTTTLTLTLDPEVDRARVVECVTRMREELEHIPEDPYLLYSTVPERSERRSRAHLPSRAELIDTILDASQGSDLVGFCASGTNQRGFASSLGHRHFHEVQNLQLDWSLYACADKAVKTAYATDQWNRSDFLERMARARSTLALLQRPAKTIPPGRYRTYLAAPALAELVSMLNWQGFSEKALRTRTSCLQKLADGEAQLSAKFTLRENTAQGLEPLFDEVGFVKPPSVDLIVSGRYASSLIGPRTAKEYALMANADAEECLRSFDVLGGELAAGEVLPALDTGVYVSNLWYLNFSDRLNARITGMTRFASFWVEHGQIVAPLSVMRFDDSLYRMLGPELLGLSQDREFMVSSHTYDHRSLETHYLPGALIDEIAFTL